MLRQDSDSHYMVEARKLLVDEFVCFTESDVESVFEKFDHSYSRAWHVLSEAETDGKLAKYPIQDLRPPRGNPTLLSDIQSSCLQSQSLQTEVAEVLKFWKQSRREFSCWASGLFFSSDQDGKEQLLDADGKQVMMEWERPYMERCVDALRIDEASHVLEIGFGCAYSAEQIQLARPRSHTIVECSPTVLKRLHAWARDRPNVRVVEGTWQEKLPDLGIFDCVFFDDYGLPGLADREMAESCPHPEYCEEYSKALEEKGGTHFLAFLNIIARWHARVGTRMSGYLHYPVQMQRDDLEAVYQHMSIDVPDHCNYFPGQKLWPYALVPLFIKRDPGFEDELDTTAGSQTSPSKSPSPSSQRGRRQSRSRSRSR